MQASWGIGGDVYSHGVEAHHALGDGAPLSRRYWLSAYGVGDRAPAPLARPGTPAGGARDTFAPGALFWLAFHALVICCVAVDLLYVGRARVGAGGGAAGTAAAAARQAAAWSAVCVCVSLAVAAYVFWAGGAAPAAEFLCGYVVELTLSCDNLFVIMLSFKTFAIKSSLQRRVLNVGICSAMVMRAAFIFAGGTLVARFSWVLDLFGVLLVYAAAKLVLSDDDEEEENATAGHAVRLLKRVVPVTTRFEKDAFFTREKGKLVGTPLLVALVAVEACDVVFALDSIPAIFSITQSAAVVYTSNICAIIGLRSLFMLLSTALQQFAYLKYGLAAVLGFMGAKILLAHWFHVPVAASLGVVAAILLATFAAGGKGRPTCLPT